MSESPHIFAISSSGTNSAFFLGREMRLEVILATDYIIRLGFANDSSVRSMDWRIEAVPFILKNYG